MHRVVWLLAMVGPAALAQPLTLHYQERPPYSSTQPGGGVVGLVAAPAAAALRQAGIEFQWASTPSQRQLALIQSGHGLHCGIGWYQSAQRSALGRFSRPLYRDKPLGALVRANAGMGTVDSAAALVGDTRFTLLVKEGYSYGAMLDALIERTGARVLRTHVEPVQMSQMLRSGRADWMLVSPEEGAVLEAPELRRISFNDVPVGGARHIYCNFAVPQAWLDRIDQALPTLPTPAGEVARPRR